MPVTYYPTQVLENEPTHKTSPPLCLSTFCNVNSCGTAEVPSDLLIAEFQCLFTRRNRVKHRREWRIRVGFVCRVTFRDPRLISSPEATRIASHTTTRHTLMFWFQLRSGTAGYTLTSWVRSHDIWEDDWFNKWDWTWIDKWMRPNFGVKNLLSHFVAPWSIYPLYTVYATRDPYRLGVSNSLRFSEDNYKLPFHARMSSCAFWGLSLTAKLFFFFSPNALDKPLRYFFRFFFSWC